MRCGQGMRQVEGQTEGALEAFFFYNNDRVLGSWILFSTAIWERSRAWTAQSVGPVFISGPALQH